MIVKHFYAAYSLLVCWLFIAGGCTNQVLQTQTLTLPGSKKTTIEIFQETPITYLTTEFEPGPILTVPRTTTISGSYVVIPQTVTSVTTKYSVGSTTTINTRPVKTVTISPTQTAIDVVSISPASPSTLGPGDRIVITLSYVILDPGGARINANPFAGYYVKSSQMFGCGLTKLYISNPKPTEATKLNSIWLYAETSSGIIWEQYTAVDYTFTPY